MKQKIGAILVLAALASPAAAKKPKDPGETQTYGCVTLAGIKAHSFPMNLEAHVLNGCGSAVMLSITVGYFERSGAQYGSHVEFVTVAAGANYAWRHWPGDYHEGPWKMRIISVIGNRI